MGMFDKDKEIGLLLNNTFEQGEQFILWNAEVTRDDFPTKFGPSPQVTLTVSKLASPRDQMQVTTLAAAIVAKVREAERDDFPAVVFWRLAPADRSPTGSALVLQFVKAWGNVPNAHDPATAAAMVNHTPGEPLPGTDTAAKKAPAGVGQDDIPF